METEKKTNISTKNIYSVSKKIEIWKLPDMNKDVLPVLCNDGRLHLHETFQFLCICLWLTAHTDKHPWNQDTQPCWTNNNLVHEHKEKCSPTDLSPWTMKVSLPTSNRRDRAQSYRTKQCLSDIGTERCFAWHISTSTKKEKTTREAGAAWWWPVNCQPLNKLL